MSVTSSPWVRTGRWPRPRARRPRFPAPGRAAWRRWLARNHAACGGIWFVDYRTGAGRTPLGYEAAVEEALCFGWIDGVRRSFDEEAFVIRFSDALSMSLGTLLFWLARRSLRPGTTAHRALVENQEPAAAGIIAGRHPQHQTEEQTENGP